ncbi:MAG: ADP-polyphosphate phosphotransferase [Phycisphaerales bacterium]
MKLHTDVFRVSPGKNVNLKSWPTTVEPLYDGKKQYQKILDEQIEAMSSWQQRLYAADRHALLLIFQAMDAAGKDGVIRHVMSGINPQGCQVFSFKHPSATELDHDFLWRTTQCLPERGRIGIFNRSYYEEVLIVRVHPEILEAEKLPETRRDTDEVWEGRYRSIVELENHLARNGTRVVKFFLHLSKEEQRKRFIERIDDPEKNWKFSPDDLRERAYWKQYRSAYEECMSATSTKQAPWYVIPADDKQNARLIVSEVILDTFRDINPEFPKTGAANKAELQTMRAQLENERDD